MNRVLNLASITYTYFLTLSNSTNKLVEVVTFLTYTLVVLGSNLGLDTNYHE
jgi:hypothetical protein